VSGRPLRELFLDSRWTLGNLLRKIERAQGNRADRATSVRAVPKSAFSDELKRLNLAKPRAIEAQRISA
jgi:hypothetical protein